MAIQFDSSVVCLGYYSSLYTDELADQLRVITNKQDRERFFFDNYVPELAKNCLSKIDLNLKSIIIYSHGSIDANVFFGIDKVKLVRDKVLIDIIKVSVNACVQGYESDCKCFMMTAPAALFRSKENPYHHIPDNIVKKLHFTSVDQCEEFEGYNYDYNNDDFFKPLTLAESTTKDPETALSVAEKRRHYLEYIHRASKVQKRVCGMYWGGISEGTIKPASELICGPTHISSHKKHAKD